jgi:hypothetical protein
MHKMKKSTTSSQNDIIKIGFVVVSIGIVALLLFALKNPLNTDTRAGFRQKIVPIRRVSPKGIYINREDDKESKERNNPTDRPEPKESSQPEPRTTPF